METFKSFYFAVLRMTFASILIRFVFIDWKKFNFEAFMTVEESVLILFHADD